MYRIETAEINGKVGLTLQIENETLGLEAEDFRPVEIINMVSGLLQEEEKELAKEILQNELCLSNSSALSVIESLITVLWVNNLFEEEKEDFAREKLYKGLRIPERFATVMVESVKKGIVGTGLRISPIEEADWDDATIRLYRKSED